MLRELLDLQRGSSAKIDTIHMRPADPGQQAPPAGADNNAKSYHIDNVMNLQREAYDAVKALRFGVCLFIHLSVVGWLWGIRDGTYFDHFCSVNTRYGAGRKGVLD